MRSTYRYFVCSLDMDFRFLKPIVFNLLFLLGPFPLHPSHIRLVVAHCYLPQLSFPCLFWYPTTAFFINNPKRHPFLCDRQGQRICYPCSGFVPNLPPTPLAHMPLAIPTLKRKPEEEDDILSKRRNEAMLHMARLAYERMKRIDKEDHERGLKEQQYNNSVKYQRMVEYELNNPGETATVRSDHSVRVSRSSWILTQGHCDREFLSTKRSLRGRGGDE